MNKRAKLQSFHGYHAWLETKHTHTAQIPIQAELNKLHHKNLTRHHGPIITKVRADQCLLPPSIAIAIAIAIAA